MLIHDRGELICKFIIAGVRFMLHGMPPRLTQGYWHIPSITHYAEKVLRQGPVAVHTAPRPASLMRKWRSGVQPCSDWYSFVHLLWCQLCCQFNRLREQQQQAWL